MTWWGWGAGTPKRAQHRESVNKFYSEFGMVSAKEGRQECGKRSEYH